MSSSRDESRSGAKSSAALPALLLVVPAAIVAGYFALRAPSTEPAETRGEPARVPAVAPPPSMPPVANEPAVNRPAQNEPRVPADDASAFAEIEPVLTSDPERALALVQAQNERFPESSLRDDRDWAKVRALVNLQRIGKARDAAKQFYVAHPDSPLVPRVHSLTGMHLPPKLGPSAP